MNPSSPEERHHLAWETALDRLELDVLVCERMVGGDVERRLRDWDAPDDLGPVPADLLPRAQQLHARQLAVAERVAGAALALRRRQEDLASEGGTYAAAGRSAYVDTHA